MAEEKVVNLKINSNVVETTEDVKKLNSALDNTAKEVDNVNEAGQGTSTLTSGFNKAGDAVEALQPGLKGAVSGMKEMLVQMWAIVANPIGLVVAAIVAGLTLLYKAFENGERQDRFGLNDIIRPTEQTEWDVEIEMQPSIGLGDKYTPDNYPQLDENKYLILKRI